MEHVIHVRGDARGWHVESGSTEARTFASLELALEYARDLQLRVPRGVIRLADDAETPSPRERERHGERWPRGLLTEVPPKSGSTED